MLPPGLRVVRALGLQQPNGLLQVRRDNRRVADCSVRSKRAPTINMRALDRWKARARQLKTDVYALYLAYKDPRVPWHARLFAACVVGYAFSPIDLILDPIPILGYLDDLVLVPLGVALAIKLIPPQVFAECRRQAQEALGGGKPTNWIAGGIIVAVWLLLAAIAIVLIRRMIWGMT